MQFMNYLDTQLTFELQAPLILKEGIILYRDLSRVERKRIPADEKERLKANELKPIQELFKNGDSLFLKDEILGIELWIKIKFAA
jgi:hypothetical protein